MKRNYEEYLTLTLNELENAVERAEEGQISAYQTIAFQLRKLVCSGEENNLLERAISNPTFHRLKEPPKQPSAEKYQSMSEPRKKIERERWLGMVKGIPSILSLKISSPPQIELEFDWTSEPIPVAHWRRFNILRVPKKVSIDAFIRKLTGEDAGHFKEDVQEDLAKIDEAITIVISGENYSISRSLITALGNYILGRSRKLIEEERD